MDGKPEAEGEGEGMEWELLHHNPNTDDGDGLDLGPQLQDSALIRPDYFSLHPPTPVSSNSSSSTDPNEVDRNFDDSYVANQLFPQFFLSNTNHHHHPSPSSSTSSNLNQSLSNDSDSDSDSGSDAKVIEVPHTTTTSSSSTELLDDAAAHRALDPKEEDEQEHNKDKEKEMVREEEEEEEERRVAWWKVPFEVFKYWVVRVSPIPAWSLSVAAAAAFLGLVILGRRLYKMKRKTQTLKLNVALDDKKVSQLMGRVARLNEAFSVVRRVPIVRPSLPAPSVTLRPVMSMR